MNFLTFTIKYLGKQIGIILFGTLMIIWLAIAISAYWVFVPIYSFYALLYEYPVTKEEYEYFYFGFVLSVTHFIPIIGYFVFGKLIPSYKAQTEKQKESKND